MELKPEVEQRAFAFVDYRKKLLVEKFGEELAFKIIMLSALLGLEIRNFEMTFGPEASRQVILELMENHNERQRLTLLQSTET